ncbi:hypothetical protein CDL15_Pgr016128 [Punica granatum]|uniref:Fibronectin type III-like domain-containing protein n=1 Tax=Punica granatum TaxID=22663 RepID=A0A218X0A5_PUNGR|nr:hypothetical protein CDL15_Pgr016128 [Punica granatum]
MTMRNRRLCFCFNSSVSLCLALCLGSVWLDLAPLSRVSAQTDLDPVPRVSAQTPAFACDVESNPTLMGFPFCNASLGVQDRVADLVKRLTLREKIGFMGNDSVPVSRLGIPRYVWWNEALHGITKTGPGGPQGAGTTRFTSIVPAATSFPQVILTAASFNTTLFKTIGKVVSTEARAMHNVGVAGLTFWAPNVNIFRDPRWGRGQETPGEDPLLSSKYGAGYVRGLQQRDDGDPDRLKVAACCKHYTAYDLEDWKGVDRFHFNAIVTQQDMEDTFQPSLKSCVVDGNAAGLMCSYNQVNGKPACADPDILDRVVRGQWKLNGYIVTDCDAVDVLFSNQHYTKTAAEAAAASIRAGVDVDCGPFLGRHTQDAVTAGLLDEATIDKAVSNNFATLMRLGFFDGHPRKHPLYGKLGPADVCKPENQEFAIEAARQSIVLLKNAEGTLPLALSSIKSLAVIGPNANATKSMLGNYAGIPCKYVTPLQGLNAYAPTTYAPGCLNNASCTTVQLDDAKKLAASADATVLVMGIEGKKIEGEGRDRVGLLLPGKQALLVSEVANASKGPVILVIMSGGGVDIQFAKDNDKIKGILWVGYPGGAGGAAMADIIFGAYNPTCHLGRVRPISNSSQVWVRPSRQSSKEVEPELRVELQSFECDLMRNSRVWKYLILELELGNPHLSIADSCTSFLDSYILTFLTLQFISSGGRLPITWYPQSYVEKVPMTNMNMRPDPATGYPGRTYRFYSGDTVYSFGDGLSYSKFTYHLDKAPKLVSVPSNRTCKSSDKGKSVYADKQTCRNLGFDIHLRVKNLGEMSGHHSVLLFSSPPSVHGSPRKQLLGFKKIFVRAHGETPVRFRVDVCKDLSVVDEFGIRMIALGKYVLRVGDLKYSLSVGV